MPTASAGAAIQAFFSSLQQNGVCVEEDIFSFLGTLPKTNIAPENGWLEDYFPFGMAYFQGRTVSFKEGNVY